LSAGTCRYKSYLGVDKPLGLGEEAGRIIRISTAEGTCSWSRLEVGLVRRSGRRCLGDLDEFIARKGRWVFEVVGGEVNAQNYR
jgi:hypothetical protein